MREVRESLTHLFSLGEFVDVRASAAPVAQGVSLRYDLVPFRGAGRPARHRRRPGAGGAHREHRAPRGRAPPAARRPEPARRAGRGNPYDPADLVDRDTDEIVKLDKRPTARELARRQAAAAEAKTEAQRRLPKTGTAGASPTIH